jgi:hypothetical protein
MPSHIPSFFNNVRWAEQRGALVSAALRCLHRTPKGKQISLHFHFERLPITSWQPPTPLFMLVSTS